ncbi:Niemann-Pick C1 protein, partial [Trifolium medium]|nr:Niemann-Pick C1 protein [Trifolium medium]
MDPERQHAMQFSFVQGCLSRFYRAYGRWAARRPNTVLCSSLAIVLLLCLGLIRFEVETRPEK